MGKRLFSAPIAPQIRPNNNINYYLGNLQLQGAWIGTVMVGCAWTMVAPSNIFWNASNTTNCDVALTVEESSQKASKTLTIKLQTVDPTRPKYSKSAWDEVKRAVRLVRRVIKLMFAMTPVVALYPLHYLLTMIFVLPENDEEDDAHQVALASLLNLPSSPMDWYYRVCLHCVEWSGAAAIKIMQWAGSRPDMFGEAFCAVFSQLHDDTTPHAWKHTEQTLREAYGDDWQDHLRLYGILGSGCIAQVYKGAIFDKNGKEQPVAVKVKHPNVDDDIDADLDIMRVSMHILERIPVDVFRNLKWLNLPGFIEEVATMLSIQLDLRQEADHLVRFNENFKNDDEIIFPKVCSW